MGVLYSLSPSKGSGSVCGFRQLDCRCLHKQRRRYGLSTDLDNCRRASDLSTNAEYSNKGSSHNENFELGGGFAVPHSLAPVQTEWMLNSSVISELWMEFGKPQVDLFATCLNHQLPLYMSPCPDPRALAIDERSINTSQ